MNQRKPITLILVGILVISLVLVFTINLSSIYAQNEVKYNAKLQGSNVLPPVNTTAAGRAVIFVGDDSLRWKLNVTGISDPTMVHMHVGKKGVNGSIIADLLNSAKIEDKPDRTIITGKITAADLQGPMAGRILEDLQSAFKNATTNIDLHTKSHPNGELRGTIKIQGGSANVNATTTTIN